MIALRKFNESDIEQLISWINSPELLKQFAGPDFSFPLSHIQIDELLQHPGRRLYKVVELSDERAIGHAEIFLTAESTFLCRILVGDESRRGKGMGLQIVRALLDIAFNELNRGRVELNVYAFNKNAIQCYRNAGFEIDINKTGTKDSTDPWKPIRMRVDRERWEMISTEIRDAKSKSIKST